MTNPQRRELSLDEYFAGVREGNIAVVARALTLIESNNPRHQLAAEELLTRLIPFTGKSIRLGITGAPGAGKSTLIEALGMHLVRGGHRVAVLAIDPSSGITGGSILGDKTRMPNLAAQDAAYIRPSPSAGTLGGVARKTRENMLVCEAAGYDVVLIETVGVGQSETLVVHMTDAFLALMLPGAGDELQGIKRGLLEVVDLLVVNKADGDTKAAAELSARQLRNALESMAGRNTESVPNVLTCSALHDTGVEAVWNVIVERHAQMTASGTLAERRKQQNLRWLWTTVEDRLRQSIYANPRVQAIREELERQVLAETISVKAAARQILEACGRRL